MRLNISLNDWKRRAWLISRLRNVECSLLILGRVCAALLLAGCASAPLERGGSLKDYSNLTPSDNLLTKTQISIGKQNLFAAKTVRILPTEVVGSAVQAELTDAERHLVSNAIDRALCNGLSDRFEVVPSSEQAHLTVRAAITHLGVTDKIAAGASRVASVATSITTKIFMPVPVPIPTPRIPIGLGALSVEAEAVDQTGKQIAGILWARGANSFNGKPRVSAAGDAYDLAKEFADHFNRVLIDGQDPITAFPRLPVPPSLRKIEFAMGAAPKYFACGAFGRDPGVPGLIADSIGLPPEWTDDGAVRADK